MTLTVIGAGYVGLVTAAIFSHLGNTVYCVDISQEKIELLKKGKVPFWEPSLSEYITKSVKKGLLIFTTSYDQAVKKSEIIFICVGTPSKENGEADLSFLFAAVKEAAKYLKGDKLIVIKSTIPVGFEDDLERFTKSSVKGKVEFAVCPEFLREGTAIADTLNPDRIVIGTTSQKAQETLLALHSPIKGERILCDIRSAQLIKYASNAFLATKISFANAIAIICENAGADIGDVIKGVGLDPRIGKSFLKPGVGYGGSCLPKDVLAFISQASSFGYDFELLRAVNAINSYQIELYINKIRKVMKREEKDKKTLEGLHFAVLGIAFKPNTDDIREAPALKIIQKLLDLKAEITAYDPKAQENAKKVLPDINYAKNAYDSLKNKDALLLMTEWPEFLELDFTKVKLLLKNPVVVDGRNALDRGKLEKAGLKYIGVGR